MPGHVCIQCMNESACIAYRRVDFYRCVPFRIVRALTVMNMYMLYLYVYIVVVLCIILYPRTSARVRISACIGVNGLQLEHTIEY